jgi:hypothetical protein
VVTEDAISEDPRTVLAATRIHSRSLTSSRNVRHHGARLPAGRSCHFPARNNETATSWGPLGDHTACTRVNKPHVVHGMRERHARFERR